MQTRSFDYGTRAEAHQSRGSSEHLFTHPTLELIYDVWSHDVFSQGLTTYILFVVTKNLTVDPYYLQGHEVRCIATKTIEKAGVSIHDWAVYKIKENYLHESQRRSDQYKDREDC